MTRQVTDQLYIDLEYFTPEEYYVYTAEVDSTLSSESTIDCSAEVIAGGEIVMASGEFPAFAELSCTISHIEGADLFAFTEAAIAVTVDRIRDNNTDATAIFSIATDGRLFRDITSDDTATFDVDITYLRSRSANIETQAAFSFDITPTWLRLADSQLTSEFTQTQTVDIFRDNAGSLVADSSLAVDVDKIGSLESSLTAQVDISASVSILFEVESTQSAEFTASVIPQIFIGTGANLSIDSQLSITVGRIRNLIAPPRAQNTFTAIGDAKISTANKKFGDSSLYLDGTGDWIRANSSSNFAFGLSDYTVEAWINPQVLTGSARVIWNPALPQAGNCNLYLQPNSSTTANINLYVNDRQRSSTNDVITLGVWTHVALVRYQTVTKVYVNGVVRLTYTPQYNMTGSGQATIGSDPGGSRFNGYIDDFRVSAVARYTEDFTPPSAPFEPLPGDRLLLPFEGANNSITFTDVVLSTQTLPTVSSVFAVISAVQGADIIVNGFASLTASLDRIRTSDSAITSSASVSTLGNYISGSSQCVMSAVATLYVTRNALTGRPRNLPTSTYNSTIKKFGTHSLSGTINSAVTFSTRPNLSSDWAVEAWLYKASDTGVVDAFFGWLGFAIGTDESPQFSLLDINGSTTLSFIGTGTPINLNTWNHFLLIKNSTTISFYVNGIRRFTSNTLPTSYDDYRYVSIGGSATDYYDEISIYHNTTLGYNPANTTITVPTSARIDTENTIALWHFDNNSLDDYNPAPLTQTASAALTAQATLTGGIGGPVRSSATLSSTTNFVCDGRRTSEIVLGAFSDAALITDADRFRDNTVDLNSDANLAIDGFRNRLANAIFESTANLSVDAVKTTDNTAIFNAVASNLAAVAKVGDFLITLEAFVGSTTSATKTTDIESQITSSSELLIEPLITRTIELDLADEFTQTLVFDRIRPQTLEFNCESQLSVDFVEIDSFEADLTSQFMLMCDPTGSVIGGIALFMSAGTLTIDATNIRPFSSQQSSEFTLYADTVNSVFTSGEAELSDRFVQIASGDRIRDVTISTESVASELVVVVKTTDIDVGISAISQMAVNADKITGYNSQLSSTSTLDVVVSRTQQLAAELNTDVTVIANGRSSLDLAADLTVNSSLTALGVKGTEILLQAFTNAALTATIDRIRNIGLTFNSQATVISSGDRFRDNEIDLQASAGQLTIAGISADGIAITAGTFTIDVTASVLHIQEYVYKIPGETRAYIIKGESGYRKILGETRYYKIY